MAMGRTVRAAAVTREDDGCSPSPEEQYTHALYQRRMGRKLSGVAQFGEMSHPGS